MSVLSPLLIIIGWVIVSHQHNKRETRKEIRQFLDKTISFTELLIEKSIQCYRCTEKTRKDIKSQAISTDIMRLDNNLELLNESLDSSFTAANLNESITDTDAFFKTEVSSELITNQMQLVTTNAYTLIYELEHSYRKSYQHDQFTDYLKKRYFKAKLFLINKYKNIK